MKIKMYGKNLTCRSWYRFNVRSSASVRQGKRVPIRVRLAWWFRRLADALDGAASYSYELTSTPVVPLSDRAAAIEQGIHLTRQLFDELVEKQAIEDAMLENIPELFDKPAKPQSLKPEQG